MKISLVLAMVLLLLPALSYAETEIEIGGEFEAAGIYRSDFDFDHKVHDYSRTWYGNLVVSLEASVNENISVYASYTLVDGTWGDGKYETNTGFSNASGVATDDVAYAEVRGFIFKPLTLTAGHQLNEWGNMLLADGDGVDRFGLSLEALEGLSIGAHIEKVDERDNPDLMFDTDRYGLFVLYEADEMSAGLYMTHAITNEVDAVTGLDREITGREYDAFFSGKLMGVTHIAELAMRTGNIYNTDTNDDPMAAFLSVSMDMDSLTLGGTVAYATDGFVAGPYFTPTLMTGTDQDTALFDFGELTDPNHSAHLIAIGADYGITDKWTVGAKAALHRFGKEKDALIPLSDVDLKGTEYNLLVEYEISEEAVWGLYAAQMSPDGFKEAGLTAENDKATAVVQSLFIEF